MCFEWNNFLGFLCMVGLLETNMILYWFIWVDVYFHIGLNAWLKFNESNENGWRIGWGNVWYGWFTFYICTLYTSLTFWECPNYKADYAAISIKFFPHFFYDKGRLKCYSNLNFEIKFEGEISSAGSYKISHALQTHTSISGELYLQIYLTLDELRRSFISFKNLQILWVYKSYKF